MKHPLRWRCVPGVLLCAGLLLPVASAQVQKDPQPQLLLEEAAKKELVDGDVKGAIDTYQRILKLQGVPRAVLAKALLHLGQCHEKLGTTEARNAYERLVREFADQAEEAGQARGRLAALGGRDSSMRVRQVWSGPAGGMLGSVTRDGRYLTIQDWPSENLAVRDLATGQKRRLTNKDPKTLEFAMLSVPSPDGRTVAFAWYNANDFTELRTIGIDGSNPRVLCADPTFGETLPYDWSADGAKLLAAFFSRSNGSRLVLVSVPDGTVQVLKHFERSGPKRARFSPDGRFVAYDVPQQPGSTKYDVFVLAVNGGGERPLVQHPANDVLFDWTPDGGRLLFGSDRSGAMGAWWIAVKEGAPSSQPEIVKPDLGREARPMGFTREGSYFYHVTTGMSDVEIAEIDFATGRALSPPVVAAQRYAGTNSRPGWSPDGRQLVYLSRRGPGAGWGARAICVRDMESGEVREIPTKLEMVVDVAWFPDGRTLWTTAQVAGGGAGTFRLDAQTGDFERIDLARPMGFAPAWSRDGKTLFYPQWSGAKSTSIAARDVATGAEQLLHTVTEPAVHVTAAALSPDGRRLAFALREAETGARRLKTIAVDGGDARDLLPGVSLPWPVSIAWAPDGQSVLFVKQPNPDSDVMELWRAPLRSGEPRKLDLTAPNMREIRVHPDGRHLAFTSGGDRSEVWVMENFLRPAKR